MTTEPNFCSLTYAMAYLFLVYIIMYSPTLDIDTGSKAYIIGAYTDFYPCIVNPSYTLYASPAIRAKMSEYLIPYFIRRRLLNTEVEIIS